MALLAVRVLLGAVFIFAGWAKVADLNKLAFAVRSFELVPDAIVGAIANILPYAEMALGAAIGMGVWARWGAAILAALIAAFLVAIISVLARGMVIECSCFGDYDLVCEGNLGWCNAATNSVLLGLAAAVVVRGPGRFTLDRLF